MKSLYRISIFCVLVLICAFGFFYLIQFFYPAHNQSNPKKIENQKQSLPVSDISDKTTCDTEYIIIEQDLTTSASNTFIEKIPDQYIDKTREQIVELLLQEEKAPVLSEKEKGLIHIGLSSFSSYRIVVIRQYQKEEEKKEEPESEKRKETTEFTGGYYLMAYDNYIYIYQSDMKSLYMVTEICLDDLPKPLVQEILDKKYIRDEAELYNFLESYSS